MDADRTDRVKPDYGTMIGIFVVIFWPLSLLLAIADHWFIADYDLRLVNLAVATFAAWVGVMVFEARRRRRSAEREDSVVQAQDSGWLAVRGQSWRE